MSDDISYEGIDEDVLINALYHGTAPLGMGFLHHVGSLTVEDTRADLVACVDNVSPDGKLYFDYYRGHPLKTIFDTVNKTFNPRLYDRDAGAGTAAGIVAKLKNK